MHVLAGLGPVDCQVELISATGLFVARADLHLVGTSRYPECDGGEHRTSKRHGEDLRRERLMSTGAFQRYGYTTAEIASRAHIIIRDGEDARGLRHDPARLRGWNRHAAASSLTSCGRARLAERLARYLSATRRDRQPTPPRTSPSIGGKAQFDDAEIC